MGFFGSNSQDAANEDQSLDEIVTLPNISRNSVKSTSTSAGELAAYAEGNITEDRINDIEIKHSLQSYLQPNEQPHYIFTHSSKGLRLEHPNLEKKRTPHNSGYRGNRYLIVTDRRLLFIAGWSKNAESEEGDTVIEFPYAAISDVTDSFGGILSSSGLRFTFRDDLIVTFFTQKHSNSTKAAVNYINKQINENRTPNRYLTQANNLQSKAESLAENGQYDAAIETYEKSRAIYKKIAEIAVKETGISEIAVKETGIYTPTVKKRINEIESKREEIIRQQQQPDDPHCEICGRTSDSVEIIELEGAKSKVCPDCKENLKLPPVDNSEKNNKREKSERQKVRQNLQEQVDSIQSDLHKIDSFISDSELQKADSRLDNVESQLDTLEQSFVWSPVGAGYGSDVIDGLRQSLSEKRKQLQRKKGKEEIQEDIHSIRSDLYKIDSLITDAEYSQAEQLADKIRSDISSLEQQVSHENNDILKKKLQRLKQKCSKRLSKSHVLSQLRDMDPDDFEEFVAKLWEKRGWDTRVRGGTGDRGVDIIATKEDEFEERKHLIQAKCYGEDSYIGSGEMQKYTSLPNRYPDANNYFVVSSGPISDEARAVADEGNVQIRDYDELYKMLTET